MTPFKLALEATTRHFDHLLPNHGFLVGPRHTDGAAFRRWWCRDAGWRTDVVELVYRRGGELSLPVNLLVHLPVPGATDFARAFDGRGLLTPRIPVIAARFRSSLYGRRLVRLVQRHLNWFDQFATPRECLARVTAEDRQGPRAGAFLEAMVHHLQATAGRRSA